MADHPTWTRKALAVLAGATFLAACGGSGQGERDRLPASDHVHALRALQDGSLLLGLHGGLWRSADGTTWESAGLESQDAMAIGAHDPGALIFVAGHNVLARSRDGGRTFQPLRPGDLPGLDIHAFAQAPSDPDLVYAFVVGFGLFRSGDAGESWDLRSEVGRVPPDLLALAVGPRDPDLVVGAGPENGMVRSTDGGGSFARTLEVGAWSLSSDPTDPDRLLVLSARGIEESRDGGATWTTLLHRGQELPGDWAAIAVGPDGVLWVVTEAPRTLQRSDDGGEIWQEVART
ncbi:MAG: WD40/YVTN/BNR-like repeat-containing protein [Acidimicrobiia bacterium]